MSEAGFVKLLMKTLFEFLTRDFMEQEVKVEIIGESEPVLTLEGYIELNKGAEYMLPRRIAYELESKGIARVKDDHLSIKDLSKIVYNEEATKHKIQLYKLKPYLYSLVKNTLQNMREKLRKGSSVELYDEYKKLTDLYSTLIMLRKRKIINLLNLPAIPQELIDKMSEEEKILFSILRSTLNEWEKTIGLEEE